MFNLQGTAFSGINIDSPVNIPKKYTGLNTKTANSSLILT